jgi:hypothetical protein
MEQKMAENMDILAALAAHPAGGIYFCKKHTCFVFYLTISRHTSFKEGK